MIFSRYNTCNVSPNDPKLSFICVCTSQNVDFFFHSFCSKILYNPDLLLHLDREQKEMMVEVGLKKLNK